MENSFINYIDNIKQKKKYETGYINSISEEVLKIIQEPERIDKINVNSLQIVPLFQKFISFNKNEFTKNINENNLIINSNGYSIFNYKEFSDEIELTKKISVEKIYPYIIKILSLDFNLSVNINKLSFSLLITSFIENILVMIHREKSNLILPRTLSEILKTHFIRENFTKRNNKFMYYTYWPSYKYKFKKFIMAWVF